MTPDEKQNEIVNRHMQLMMVELRNEGFKAEASIGFVAFEGPENFNLAIVVDPKSLAPDITIEQARVSLLSYAHDEICKLHEKLDEESPPLVPDGTTRH